MAAGTPKVAMFGRSLTPGGSQTFNTSGTFTVPPGVSKVNITGKGGTGTAGNPGNNASGCASGGTGGGGGTVIWTNYIQNAASDRAMGSGGGNSLGSLRGGNASLEKAQLVYGGSPGSNTCQPPANVGPPANPYYTPVYANPGVTGNSGTAGNPGSAGVAGNASSGLSQTFPGGNAGTGGNGATAGTGGGGGGAGGNTCRTYNGCTGQQLYSNGFGSRGAGGTGGGGCGAARVLNPSSCPFPTGCVLNTGTNVYSYKVRAWHSRGGGGAGVTNPGASAPLYCGNLANNQVLGKTVSGYPNAGGTCGGGRGGYYRSAPGYPCMPAPGGFAGSQNCGFAANRVGPISPSTPPAGPFTGPNPRINPCPSNGNCGFSNSYPPCNPYRPYYVPLCQDNTRMFNRMGGFGGLNPSTIRSGGGGGAGGSAGNINQSGPASGQGGGGGGGGRGNAAGSPSNPGNPGNAGTPSTVNCISVTPGGSYPIVVGGPSGGQVTISWNAQ